MTLHVDADPTYWMYIPSGFPWQGYDRVEDWSARLIDTISDLHDYSADQQELFRAYAEGLSRSHTPGEHRYAYLVQPHVETAVASFYEWDRLDSTEDALLGLHDPRAVRPPTTEEFDSPALGTGRKSIRFVADDVPDAPVNAVAHWVWRRDDRDVIMIVGDGDLVRFARLQPLYDDLARAISLVPGDEGRSSVWPTD